MKVSKTFSFLFAIVLLAHTAFAYDFTRKVVYADYDLNIHSSARGINKQIDIGFNNYGEPIVTFEQNHSLYLVEPDADVKLIVEPVSLNDFSFVSGNWGDYLAVYNGHSYYYKLANQPTGDIFYLDQAYDHMLVDADFSDSDTPHILTEGYNSGYTVCLSSYNVKTAAWQQEQIAENAFPAAIKITPNNDIVILAYDLTLPGYCFFVKSGGVWSKAPVPGLSYLSDSMAFSNLSVYGSCVAIACTTETGSLKLYTYDISQNSWSVRLLLDTLILSSGFDFCFTPDDLPAIVYHREITSGTELVLAEILPSGNWCESVLESSSFESSIISPTLEYDKSGNPAIVYAATDGQTSEIICQSVTSSYSSLADFDNSGVINLIDFSALANNWLQDGPGIIPFDLTGDNYINISDLTKFTQSWLAGRN